ncbi:unnamed protein product [Medioppia subpectinata]|uniref:Lysosome-associated membrane glycoprotein 2-like transmembrane domain-containing protein n=1 Tax=Medioppia subpectinata TaxID=1979941 RepID=A0A7R9KP02_9ACAR|nr:unnamed protein product [Medioppia subpectinata]CAG2106790.1 unnamed protein product [Medioppia subpectinata]
MEALTISFKNEFNTSATLTLTFNRTADNKTVFVQDVELSFLLSKALFPQFIDEKAYNTTVKASNPTSDLFSVASVHSYTCSAAQSVQLSHSTSGIIDIQIDFLKSKVEAYIEDAKKGEWDSEIDCKSSEISDVVPIAVGAALAGLVVIVLIAYFIGRRRSRRLAYQSV